jgi:hypothetical protein
VPGLERLINPLRFQGVAWCTKGDPTAKVALRRVNYSCVPISLLIPCSIACSQPAPACSEGCRGPPARRLPGPFSPAVIASFNIVVYAGENQLPKVVQGVKFQNGIEVIK